LVSIGLIRLVEQSFTGHLGFVIKTIALQHNIQPKTKDTSATEKKSDNNKNETFDGLS